MPPYKEGSLMGVLPIPNYPPTPITIPKFPVPSRSPIPYIKCSSNNRGSSLNNNIYLIGTFMFQFSILLLHIPSMRLLYNSSIMHRLLPFLFIRIQFIRTVCSKNVDYFACTTALYK